MPNADIDLPDPRYLALIRSDRVSEGLRTELLRRARPDDGTYAPRTMTADQFATLRALLDRVIPQTGSVWIDLAARLDATMADASGNGWRYEALPSDPEAYNQGLDSLNAIARGQTGASFADLGETDRDAIIEGLAEGRAFAAPDAPLNAAQRALWFQELRSDAARLYVAHPATMARTGYSGIANGGEAGADFAGFAAVGIGEREDFEPLAHGDRPA